MREALALYGRALTDAGSISGPAGPLVRFEDGVVVPFPVERYVGPADGLEQELLAGVRGPVLDVGCGPGRHLRALNAGGVPSLGIDLSPVAVTIARRGGGRAMVADIFGAVPSAGEWRTALLLDGNVGIGGDPVRLLERLRTLLHPEGVALVELDPPGSPVGSARARIELAGERSGWFAWGRVPACQAAAVAADAAMSIEREWSCAGRWFVWLRPATRG